MDSQNVLEDVAAVILTRMTDKGVTPERLAKDAQIALVELDAMTTEQCDNLFSVMKVLAVLNLELIVIPKE